LLLVLSTSAAPLVLRVATNGNDNASGAITRSTRNAPKTNFSNATLEQWKARGHDTNSVFADPLSVAPSAHSDWRQFVEFVSLQ